jgi:hypothetical protein
VVQVRLSLSVLSERLNTESAVLSAVKLSVRSILSRAEYKFSVCLSVCVSVCLSVRLAFLCLPVCSVCLSSFVCSPRSFLSVPSGTCLPVSVRSLSVSVCLSVSPCASFPVSVSVCVVCLLSVCLRSRSSSVCLVFSVRRSSASLLSENQVPISLLSVRILSPLCLQRGIQELGVLSAM